MIFATFTLTSMEKLHFQKFVKFKLLVEYVYKNCKVQLLYLLHLLTNYLCTQQKRSRRGVVDKRYAL